LKKGKTGSRQSKGKGKSQAKGKQEGKSQMKGKQEKKLKKKPGLKVLVPLLSKREAEPGFISVVADKAEEVILLLVIDTNAMAGGFGFATNEIAVGNALMQKAKIALEKRKTSCSDIMEWGETANKIEHLAMLHRVDRIYIVRQDNQFFKKLLQDMREKLKGIEIETIRLPEWK